MTTTEIDCPASAFQGCDSATCDRPCTARAEEIGARQRAAMAELNWFQILGASVASALITAALLFCVAAVVERGAENIRAVNIANERV